MSADVDPGAVKAVTDAWHEHVLVDSGWTGTAFTYTCSCGHVGGWTDHRADVMIAAYVEWERTTRHIPDWMEHVGWVKRDIGMSVHGHSFEKMGLSPKERGTIWVAHANCEPVYRVRDDQ